MKTNLNSAKPPYISKAHPVKFPLCLASLLFSYPGETKLFIGLHMYCSGKVKFTYDVVSFLTSNLNVSRRTIFRNVKKMETLGWMNKSKKSGVWFIKSMKDLIPDEYRKFRTVASVLITDLVDLKKQIVASVIQYLQERDEKVLRRSRNLKHQRQLLENASARKDRSGTSLAVSEYRVCNFLKITQPAVSKLIKNNQYIDFKQNTRKTMIETQSLKAMISYRNKGEGFFRVKSWGQFKTLIEFSFPHIYSINNIFLSRLYSKKDSLKMF